MKKTVILSTILLILLLIGLVVYTYYFNNPQFKTEIEIRNITKDEFYGLPEKSDININDIKKLSVKVEIINLPKCKTRDIYMPELCVIDNNTVRSLEADSSIYNSDFYSLSTKYLIFDSNQLSIDNIIEIYSKEFIVINIVTITNKIITRRYNIAEMLQDKIYN